MTYLHEWLKETQLCILFVILELFWLATVTPIGVNSCFGLYGQFSGNLWNIWKSIKLLFTRPKFILFGEFPIIHDFTALWAIKNKEMAAYLLQRRNFHYCEHIFRKRVTSFVKFVTLVKFMVNQSSSYKCCHFFVFYRSESCKVMDSRELSRKNYLWSGK